MLPSPDHSFRNRCLLLMCGTRKLQCHVQGLQPIATVGLEEGHIPLFYVVYLHSAIMKFMIHRDGGWGTSNLDQEKRRTRKSHTGKGSFSVFYASTNVFLLIHHMTPYQNKHSLAVIQHRDSDNCWELCDKEDCCPGQKWSYRKSRLTRSSSYWADPPKTSRLKEVKILSCHVL